MESTLNYKESYLLFDQLIHQPILRTTINKNQIQFLNIRKTLYKKFESQNLTNVIPKQIVLKKLQDSQYHTSNYSQSITYKKRQYQPHLEKIQRSENYINKQISGRIALENSTNSIYKSFQKTERQPETQKLTKLKKILKENDTSQYKQFLSDSFSYKHQQNKNKEKQQNIKIEKKLQPALTGFEMDQLSTDDNYLYNYVKKNK